MSTFNTPWFNSQDPSFFNVLNKSKTHHVIFAADTEDFDDSTIEKWIQEGFDVNYVPLLDGGQDFVTRVHTAGDKFGLSEQYAIIAFGIAASLTLEAHTKPNTPRLVAIAAYYPTALPSVHTRFPASVKVIVHLAGQEISVHQTSEVLGIQGRRRRVQKRIDPGEGRGQRVRLPGNFRAYTYGSAKPGFAEEDLEEYDATAAGVALGRSLEVVRKGFRIEEDIEGVRDKFTGLTISGKQGDVEKAMGMAWPDAHVLLAPTLTGGIGGEDVRDFYENFYAWPEDADVRLLSRTIGGDRVVDEVSVSLTHSVDLSWLLPGVSPTGKKLEIIMVSIFHVRGGKLESEHTYWDQASVLLQAGLLDPNLLPTAMRKQGIKEWPIVGTESARAIRRGSSREVNNLIPGW